MNKKFLIYILAIGIIIFFISNFVLQICFVHGNSMYPTLKNGQMLLVKKIDLKINNNDIVVIKKDSKIIIKRIIGIPNDQIEIIDGYVYVNGKKFDDLYIEDYGNTKEKIALQQNQYYVLGDNRQESIDSRFDEIGIIDKKNIIGIIINK